MDRKSGVGTKRAAVAGSFTNHGGPVVANPVVLPVFWGASWTLSTGLTNAALRLENFLADLLQSSIMTLLAQYGVGSGKMSVNPQSMNDSTMSGTLTDAMIQHRLQTYLTQMSFPEPDGNQVLMIFLDESLGVNDPGQGLVLCEPSGDTAFGYHNFFITAKGNPCYYAIIPALGDLCVAESCGGTGQGCTVLLSDTQEQRRTEVATHEFAEMCTDPQLNAWIDANGNEIGDVCGGINGTIIVGDRTWKVQTEWDNQAGMCLVGSKSNPPPTPPPPGNTKSSDVAVVNLLAYAFAWLKWKLGA